MNELLVNKEISLNDRLTLIGRRIKELRQSERLTQNSLMVGAHIEASKLSRIENGLMIATAEDIMRLCDFFGVTPDYLMGYDEDNKEDIFSGCDLKEINHLKRVIKFEKEEYKRIAKK